MEHRFDVVPVGVAHEGAVVARVVVRAQAGGAVVLAAGVVAAFTAASYAELVSKLPHAGGAALFVHRAFRLPLFADVSYLLPQVVPAVKDLLKLEARVKANDTVLVVAPTERDARTLARELSAVLG